MPRRAPTETKFDLKAAREKEGLTQTECADVLCTTQGTIARWESDGMMPEIYRRYWKLHLAGKKTAAPKRKVARRKLPTVAPLVEPVQTE